MRSLRLLLVDAYPAPRFSPLQTALLVLLLSTVSPAGLAQNPQAPPLSAPAAGDPPAPAKPPENPGLLNEIGKLLTAPSALLPSLKPADPATTPAPAPAPAPPAPAPAPLPPPAASEGGAPAGSRIVPGIVTGRELCPRSDNGAPDCKAGSDRLCRAKGFTTGKSLDTDAAFSCSTKPLQTRGKLCGTETFVIRAFCQ